MLGATFTDIAIWIFYPFNGPATAKLGLSDIPLGIIGEHIGDWEHITLRISNFNGLLYKVYFSQHSGGTWVDTPSLEFQESTNKVVAYSSRNGHANYSQPGLVLQEPPWLNYFRKWGPKITYGLGIELEKLGSVLSSSDLKMAFESLVDVFPDEILGEDRPTGPKVKDSWSRDEV
ncbi:hypothetical protein LIER_22269 [Lithospermum erythrorhizon]|uniref:Uncharacterized protein n=1 Tax=Lithospermum erythrorhizon TaxID=34254 RepID=A0AAV3QVJ5_LITER